MFKTYWSVNFLCRYLNNFIVIVKSCHICINFIWWLTLISPSIWYCLPYNASVTTRRTCYGSCVSGAAAELRIKFCFSCGWLGSASDSAATVPATHVSCGRRASDAPNRRRKSHSEGPFNALAPCLRGTFNIRSPCHRSRVRTAVCVSVPQWHGAGAPLACVARTDILPAQSINSELPSAPFWRPYPSFWVPSPRWTDDNLFIYFLLKHIYTG